LQAWKYPYKDYQNFGCKDFKPFIPSNADTIELGKVWNLVKRIDGQHVKNLSNNR
jgi:hypothetical protein